MYPSIEFEYFNHFSKKKLTRFFVKKKYNKWFSGIFEKIATINLYNSRF